MKHSEAINILNPSANDEDSLKTAYKTACKTYHPDVNPNGLEMMKLVNVAYEHLKKWLGSWDHAKHATDEKGIDEIFTEILNKISHLEGLEIEVCGTWLWVGGNTKEHKDTIKEAGLKWAKKKAMWYWRPADCKVRFHKKTLSMNEIRVAHGSTNVDTERKIQKRLG